MVRLLKNVDCRFLPERSPLWHFADRGDGDQRMAAPAGSASEAAGASPPTWLIALN